MDVEELIDRRKLRRKVSFWRIATLIILGWALLSAGGYGLFKLGLFDLNREHIARVDITGVITNDEPMLKLLKKLEDDDNVKGVILHISSPGGSTVGGEVMFEAVRSLADKKPVVTSVGSLAASAGYMIAAASDHIVAQRSSIVGSIGVLFQYADASQLLDKIGLKIKAVKSSPLKAEPSPFNPASDETIEMLDKLIKDSYDWFVGIVIDRRNMNKHKAYQLADGSIFTGAQGLENGLIDAIGGQNVAVSWLNDKHDLDEKLKVVKHLPKRPSDSLFSNPTSLKRIASIFGIEIGISDAARLEKAIHERLLLDGLVSIWQGSL